MESLLTIMTRPERAKIADAVRVLHTILGDEILKIETNFQTMRDTLNAQISAANELQIKLGEQNEKLVTLANDASKKISLMSDRLDNTVSGLCNIVSSSGWNDVELSTEKFSTTVNELLSRIDTTSQSTLDKTIAIREQIDAWLEAGESLKKCLNENFTDNDTQMKNLVSESDTMQQKLSDLSQSVANGFDAVRSAANDYENLLGNNDKLLTEHLNKMDSFSKQSKKQLTNQMNTLTNTANVVGGQVRLAESSIEKQIRKLTDAVETLTNSATTTESSVRGISTELTKLTNRFNGEIKDFASGVVQELKTVSGVADTTLENTKNAAGAFSESVRAMATGVRETLIEMNTAHTQLSGQSASLIKLSAETTAQLQPLSELIEKYYAALPDLSQSSQETSEKLEKIVSALNEKITQMKSAVTESTSVVSESAIKIEDLAGESRQQMIDLMSDYAKAVNTMQTLNKQMMVARATAPMDAIKATPTANFGRISSSDFLAQSERMFDKLHEQSLDLTRATGAEIPDVVWTKYHAGDKTIFSKWFAKMLGAADKKRIRDMLKNDNVFQRQATQFVHGFDKLLMGAKQTDNPDALAASLLKTELGQIYVALKAGV